MQQNRPTKLSKILDVLKKIGTCLSKLRDKNPSVFDNVYRAFGVITGLVSLSNIFSKTLVVSISTIFCFFISLLAQWAKLTSKQKAQMDRVTENYESEISSLQKDKTDRIQALSMCSKGTISGLNQLLSRKDSPEIFEQEFAEFLLNSLTSIEDILYGYYKTKFSASVYLLTRKNVLRLFGFGDEFTKCRGGRKKVSNLRGVSIKSSHNDVFKQLVEDKLNFYMSNNLPSTFSWQKGYTSDVKFQSILGVPIKEPKRSSTENTLIVGVLCIDTSTNIIEWNYDGTNAEHIFAYNMTLFLAEILSPLCFEYLKVQENRRKQKGNCATA